MHDSLAFWSAVALLLRVLAIGVFIYIARLQFNEFKYKNSLQPLKQLLFYFVIGIIISQIPIMYLHVLRIQGITASSAVTSFATVSNAAATLVVAILMYLVYKFKGNDE